MRVPGVGLHTGLYTPSGPHDGEPGPALQSHGPTVVSDHTSARDGSAASPLLAAALRYAALGWCVFPGHGIDQSGRCSCRDSKCGHPGKHPRINAWQKSATTDKTVIENWWRRWPTANVCIATGAASGIVVLDVDPRHGGAASLEALEREHGPLPLTPTVRTGGGGFHYFFSHPGGRVLNRVNVLPGVDVRGDGGFVVAPPSRHVSGEVYSWN